MYIVTVNMGTPGNHADLIFPEKFDAIQKLSEAASRIALQNFEWRYITFVFFNSTLWCGAELFLQSYKKISIVGKGLFYPSFVHKTSQYVLFGLDIADIEHMLIWMHNHEFDNTGRYIVVCQSQELEDCDETEAVKTLWAYKVTNVVFLKLIEDNVNGYTYYPLNDSDCRTDVPVKLTNFNSCFNGTLYKNCRDIFSDKLRNMNNCPLIASSFIQPPYMYIVDGVPSGANGDLLRILAEGLNASLKMMTPRIGNGWGKLENGSWSGSLADVYNNYANLSITSAALTLARFSHFHMSIGYDTGSVVWVTHPAKIMPSSIKLTRPFQLNAQIAVGMCFLLIVICSMILRSRFWRFSENIDYNKPRSSIVFYSWMICMGLPSTRLPTKPAYSYMMLLWMWFCMFIRTFYQVSLIDVLKANYYFEEFQTIDDVMLAGYPFGGGAALKDYFIERPDVYNQWTNLKADDIIPMMRNTSKGVEFVVAMSLETAQVIISVEKINVHILPQKIVTSPTVIFFKKFSPLAQSINKILMKLIESGFTEKLMQTYAGKINEAIDVTVVPMKLNHFSSCYVVLFTGWIISFLFFVGELIFDIMYKSKPRRS